MGPPRVADLVLLGLPEHAARTYLVLLAECAGSDADVAALTGTTVREVRESFAALHDAGLVSLDGSGAVASPVRPGPGLDLLVRRREAELRQARTNAVNAFEAAQESFVRAAAAHELVEVIGGGTVADRVRHLESTARAQIRGFDSPPYYADPTTNRVELDNLGRGVRYRVIYASAALERVGHLTDHVLPGVDRGEEARTLGRVPVKLMLFDDDCAVVSTTVSPAASPAPAALLIRPCSLLAALTGLFETCWRAALPFDVRARTARQFPRPHERRLLALLAAGLSDEQVARTLGVSRRTVFRYLENLMARAGAANRFQLALHAARNDWI